MDSGRSIDLDVLHVFQDRSDVISIQTRDRQIFNLGGNAPRHLFLSPPFLRAEDGSLVVRKGYVRVCNTISFHFVGGPLHDTQMSCTLTGGHMPVAEDEYVGRHKALRHFADTRGGEPGQKFEVPAEDDLAFYEYEVERRAISFEERPPEEFPVVGIVVDVFCKAVEVE